MPDGKRRPIVGDINEIFHDLSIMRIENPCILVPHLIGRKGSISVFSEINHFPFRADSSGRTPAKQPTVIIGSMSIAGMRIEIAPNFFRRAAFYSSGAFDLLPVTVL